LRDKIIQGNSCYLSGDSWEFESCVQFSRACLPLNPYHPWEYTYFSACFNAGLQTSSELTPWGHILLAFPNTIQQVECWEMEYLAVYEFQEQLSSFHPTRLLQSPVAIVAGRAGQSLPAVLLWVLSQDSLRLQAEKKCPTNAFHVLQKHLSLRLEALSLAQPGGTLNLWPWS
jgi:hypothetical protein